MYSIRLMQTADVEAIMTLQTFCYEELLLESEPTVRERLRLAANECWVAEDHQGVCAYLFAYRSSLGAITALDGIFKPASNGTCYYVHDLAVHPRMAGQGVGRALINNALAQAKAQGYNLSALVSVQNSAPFWQRLGYEPVTVEDSEQAANLASYQIEAVYMVNTLGLKTL